MVGHGQSAMLDEAVESLSRSLRARTMTISTVESCTGGMLGAAITALAGSSELYPGGIITYSNRLKRDLAGVSEDTLRTHGAVSAQTAIEMAQGGRVRLGADLAIAITGIAGPGGGSEHKPVGTVWICVAGAGEIIDCRRFVFPGDRSAVRLASAISAAGMAIQRLENRPATLEHERERFDG